MARVLKMDGSPWRSSQAGWMQAQQQISARIDRWRRRRQVERAGWHAVVGICLVLALGALDAGTAWALALSAAMLVGLVVAQARGGR